jgi:hypothetical protein
MQNNFLSGFKMFVVTFYVLTCPLSKESSIAISYPLYIADIKEIPFLL